MKLTRNQLRKIIKEELLLEMPVVHYEINPLVLMFDYYTPPKLQVFINKNWAAISRAAATVEASPLGQSLMARFGITSGGLVSSLKAGSRAAPGVLMLMYASGKIGFNIGEELVKHTELGPIASGKKIPVDLDLFDFEDMKANAAMYSGDVLTIILSQPANTWMTVEKGIKDIDYAFAWEQLRDITARKPVTIRTPRPAGMYKL
jgi:hypothetical protein